MHMDIGLASTMLSQLADNTGLTPEGMPMPGFAGLLVNALKLQYYHQIYWLEVG